MLSTQFLRLFAAIAGDSSSAPQPQGEKRPDQPAPDFSSLIPPDPKTPSAAPQQPTPTGIQHTAPPQVSQTQTQQLPAQQMAMHYATGPPQQSPASQAPPMQQQQPHSSIPQNMGVPTQVIASPVQPTLMVIGPNGVHFLYPHTHTHTHTHTPSLLNTMLNLSTLQLPMMANLSYWSMPSGQHQPQFQHFQPQYQAQVPKQQPMQQYAAQPHYVTGPPPVSMFPPSYALNPQSMEYD